MITELLFVYHISFIKDDAYCNTFRFSSKMIFPEDD